MNPYYLPPAYYRNQEDTRFFPFFPFVAGLATGGLLALPFLYNRPFYPPVYPAYPGYPGFGMYGGVMPGAFPYGGAIPGGLPYGGAIPGAVPYGGAIQGAVSYAPPINVASQQYIVQ